MNLTRRILCKCFASVVVPSRYESRVREGRNSEENTSATSRCIASIRGQRSSVWMHADAESEGPSYRASIEAWVDLHVIVGPGIRDLLP